MIIIGIEIEVEIQINGIGGTKMGTRMIIVDYISLERVEISGTSGSRLEYMMDKILKQLQSTDVGIKEIRGDISDVT